MTHKQKQAVDTPREGAWCEKVNEPGFMKQPDPPKPLVIGTMTLEEYRQSRLRFAPK